MSGTKRKKTRKKREPVDETKIAKKEKVVDKEQKEKKAAACKAAYGDVGVFKDGGPSGASGGHNSGNVGLKGGGAQRGS